jgi:hypothetical protein
MLPLTRLGLACFFADPTRQDNGMIYLYQKLCFLCFFVVYFSFIRLSIIPIIGVFLTNSICLLEFKISEVEKILLVLINARTD